MFNKLTSYNKIKRKQFFASLGTGAFGFAAAGSLILKLFGKKEEAVTKQISVQINPLAVSRKKIGDKNV